MDTCSNCGSRIQGKFKFCPSCGSQVVVVPAAEPSLLGKTLNNKYRIISKIGSGGMGTVYLAEHTGLRKQVAIKVLRSDLQVTEESLKRFQREGIAAGKFNHPNAIQIYDFDRSEDQTFYLAMEYVKGSTLKAMILREERLSPETAVDIARKVLSVLEEAHRNGIVHRDLKPENIMVIGRDDGEQEIKVLDFGLSKLIDLPVEDSILTQVGGILGSPRYMAPEQCSGGLVDHRIDLYAIGLILFEMLAGEPPSQGDTLTEIIIKRTSKPAPALTDQHPDLQVPTGLDVVVRKALKRDPDLRYQSAREMIQVLDEMHSAPVAEHRVRRPEPEDVDRRARPAKRFWTPALLGVLVVVALIVGALLIINGSDSSGPDAAYTFVSMKSPEERTELENRYAARLEDARSRLRSRELDVALAIVEDAVPMECADAEAYLVRGMIYYERGDFDMARADFEEALRIEEGYAAAAAGLGWVLFEENDLQKALARFEHAANIDGNCAEALAGQGAVHSRLGDRAKAKAHLEGALEIEPSLTIAHYHLGMTLIDDGDVDKAIDAFIQAKRHDTKSVKAHVGLGEAYLCRGEADQAERQFRDALLLDPDALEARTALATLQVEGDRFSEAQPLIEEGIRRHPGVGRLHILLGVTLEAAGRNEEAIESLQKGVELESEDADARILLGILLQRQGQFLEAFEQYRSASAIDDSNALAFLNQGLALFAMERFDEAGQAFEKALSIDSDNAFIHYNLGILYMDYLIDREGRAVEHLQRFEALGGLDIERNQKVRRWLEAQGL